MTSFLHIIPVSWHDRALGAVRRWQAFSETPLGARLAPLYASLLGAGVAVLVADRLVRSMWRHAIFTGPAQWRTVALLLTLLWIAIGVAAALALLGPPPGSSPEDDDGETVPDGRSPAERPSRAADRWPEAPDAVRARR